MAEASVLHDLLEKYTLEDVSMIFSHLFKDFISNEKKLFLEQNQTKS